MKLTKFKFAEYFELESVGDHVFKVYNRREPLKGKKKIKSYYGMLINYWSDSPVFIRYDGSVYDANDFIQNQIEESKIKRRDTILTWEKHLSQIQNNKIEGIKKHLDGIWHDFNTINLISVLPSHEENSGKEHFDIRLFVEPSSHHRLHDPQNDNFSYEKWFNIDQKNFQENFIWDSIIKDGMFPEELLETKTIYHDLHCCKHFYYPTPGSRMPENLPVSPTRVIRDINPIFNIHRYFPLKKIDQNTWVGNCPKTGQDNGLVYNREKEYVSLPFVNSYPIEVSDFEDTYDISSKRRDDPQYILNFLENDNGASPETEFLLQLNQMFKDISIDTTRIAKKMFPMVSNFYEQGFYNRKITGIDLEVQFHYHVGPKHDLYHQGVTNIFTEDYTLIHFPDLKMGHPGNLILKDQRVNHDDVIKYNYPKHPLGQTKHSGLLHSILFHNYLTMDEILSIELIEVQYVLKIEFMRHFK